MSPLPRGPSGRSSVLQDSADAVARDTQDGLAQVPDAAGLGLQPLGGAVAGEAVQATGAAVVGLVQAGQAPVRQSLVWGPEGGGASASKKKSVSSRGPVGPVGPAGPAGHPPAVPGALQAAVVAAGFGAAGRAGPAGASAGGLIQHGQVGGGGVSGGALGGGAPGLPHHRRVGVPEQQPGEVGLLEDLAALVHHGAAAGRGGEKKMEGGFPGTSDVTVTMETLARPFAPPQLRAGVQISTLKLTAAGQRVHVSASVLLPLAPLAVEEAGPLEAGLLAAHPEDGGDPHHQHHHVLEQEQAQVGTAAGLHLQQTARQSDSATGCNNPLRSSGGLGSGQLTPLSPPTASSSSRGGDPQGLPETRSPQRVLGLSWGVSVSEAAHQGGVLNLLSFSPNHIFKCQDFKFSVKIVKLQLPVQ